MRTVAAVLMTGLGAALLVGTATRIVCEWALRNRGDGAVFASGLGAFLLTAGLAVLIVKRPPAGPPADAPVDTNIRRGRDV